MPRKEVRRDGALGGEMKRVTVVGAVLIAALVLIALITIKALTDRNNGDQKKVGQ